MKKRTKLLAFVLAGVMLTGCMTGCGAKEGNKNDKGGQSATDIQISYWRSGLDIGWLDAVIAAFEEKHPEYNVYYNETADLAASKAAYGLEDVDTVDLYMTTSDYDTTYLESLNDVLDTTVEGESKSIREKFNENYLKLEQFSDGNYYNLTFGGGVIGFVYNTKIFEEAGVEQLPRTTDELALLCSNLADRNIVPLCHFQNGGYWWQINELWYAQYEGADAYYDFYKNPTKERMMEKDGRYEVLKVNEKLLTPEYVMPGSNAENHVSVQTKFLNGRAAMMINGSWLSSEMLHTDKINDFVMMKTPVISSIVNKLTTVKNDQQLRKLIDAIDTVIDGVKTEDEYKDGENYLVDGITVSAADWARVKEARGIMAANHADLSCFIPKYSNAKDGAKEFLKFFYSDEGYKVYQETLNLKMPLSMCEGEVDTSEWNNFMKNQAELLDKMETAITVTSKSKHPIFIDGGAWSFGSEAYDFRSLMCSNNEEDRVSADEAWDYIYNLINDNYEKTWLKNIKK